MENGDESSNRDKLSTDGSTGVNNNTDRYDYRDDNHCDADNDYRDDNDSLPLSKQKVPST